MTTCYLLPSGCWYAQRLGYKVSLKHFVHDGQLAEIMCKRPNKQLGQHKHKDPSAPQVSIRKKVWLAAVILSEKDQRVLFHPENWHFSSLQYLNVHEHDNIQDPRMDDVHRVCC